MANRYGIPCRIDGRQNPEYHRRHYDANKEHRSETMAEWRKKNPKYPRLHNLDYHQMVISLLIQRDGRVCEHCGLEIADTDISIDHKRPRCVGGTNEAKNLRLLHKRCNSTRQRSTYRG